jgi:hypothetical protein
MLDSPLQEKLTIGRKPADIWDTTLFLATRCREKFEESATTIEELEKQSTEALSLLTQSSVSSMTPMQDMLTQSTILPQCHFTSTRVSLYRGKRTH